MGNNIFKVGDIIRLKEDTFWYKIGLLCKIVEAEPFDNARVEIIGGTLNSEIGKLKYANLKLFELVERGKNDMLI